MNYIYRIVLISGFIILSGCSTDSLKLKPKQSPDEKIVKIADSFFDAYKQRYPRQSTRKGLNNHFDHRLEDLSVEASKAWENENLNYLKQLEEIKKVGGVKNISLLSSIEFEVKKQAGHQACKVDLWKVDQYGSAFTDIRMTISAQPFDTEKNQKDAIARYSQLPLYFTTAIDNLKLGLSLGISTPKHLIAPAVRKIRVLTADITEDSFLMKPIKKIKNPEIASKWKETVLTSIIPSFNKFANYLESEYEPKARETISITDFPQPYSESCYSYLSLNSTTANMTPQQIAQLLEPHEEEMRKKALEYGKKEFNVDTLNSFFKGVSKRDKDNPYKDSKAILAAAEIIIQKYFDFSKTVIPQIPKAEIKVMPIPLHDRAGAIVGRYQPSINGKPAEIQLGVNNEIVKFKKSSLSRLVAHEAVPGHHIQKGLAMELDNTHPSSKAFSSGAFTEGWAVYAEMLIDENGLYDRNALGGYLVRRVARNLLVRTDIGIHQNGWSRSKAVGFLMDNGYKEKPATSSVDAITAYPALMLAYSIPPLQIMRIRRDAEEQLKEKFKLKEFHGEVLRYGDITLGLLEHNIKKWVRSHN